MGSAHDADDGLASAFASVPTWPADGATGPVLQNLALAFNMRVRGVPKFINCAFGVVPWM